jgi:putative transposase
VLNRATARLDLFRKDGGYVALLHVLLTFCVMPTHWHFVAWPRGDGELTECFRWLTHTHTMR